jgi:putative flippase GtrA
MTLASPPALPRTVIRFGMVGMANTAIDLTLFWVLEPSLGVVLANLVSTSAGMAFSFWANGRHTFGAARVTTRQALAFLATNALTQWLLQPVVIGAAHGLTGLDLPAAKVVALGASVVANFLLYRYVVWARPRAGAAARFPG